MARSSRLLIVSVVAALCAGCSTPPPVLDQARNTGALTAALQGEVEAYRSVQARIAQQRIDNIRVQLDMVARNEARNAYTDLLDEAVGNTEPKQLYRQLLELATAQAQLAEAHRAKLKGIDDQLSKVLAPLPDTNAKLAAAQKAVLPLGEELSASERLNALTLFAKAVKDGIDEAKQKIDEAQKATPAPPTPASD
jgi:hypothetical protein